MTKLTKTRGNRTVAGLLLTVLLSLTAVGCGSGEEPAEGGRVSTGTEAAASYIAEDYPLSQDNIIGITTYQNTLFYLNQDVSDADSSQQTLYRMDMGSEQGEAAAVPLNLAEGQSVSLLTADETGKLHAMAIKTDENANATLTELLWIKLDEAGNEAGSVSLIDFYNENNQQIPTDFEVDGSGNIYLSMGDKVYVLDPEGKLLYEAQVEGMIMYMCRDADGKVYAVWYSTGGESLMGMAEIDSQAKAMGAIHDISVTEILLGISTGAQGSLLMATTSSVYSYHIEEKTMTELFKWSDIDVATDYYGLFQSLADGRLLWLGRSLLEDGSMKASLKVVRPRREGDAVQESKETLTFGGISLLIDAAVREAIVKFNSTDPDYRIEIIEYGVDDLVGGLEQMNADIVSGNGPDIMALPAGYSLSMYASKGVLEDMYPFLENDASVDQADLQANILSAFETDGKLYGMPVTFMLYSVMGRTSVVGTEDSWNLDEMIAMVDRIGDDSRVFYNTSKSGVLNFCLIANNDIMINWDDSEKGFNRGTFLKILEFANRFQDDDQFDPTDISILVNGLREGDIQLFDTALMNMSVHQVYNSLFGEPVTYVGYPSENGSGSLAGSVSLMALSSQCSDKEAAWRFISSMLTEEYQDSPSLVMGLPIRKESLVKRLEQAKEANYVTDENGNQQEAPIQAPLGDQMLEIYAATEADVQAVISLIDNVEKMQDQDSQIAAIISEEAQTYFSGDKSAEEVADVVENRIQLYMSEMG